MAIVLVANVDSIHSPLDEVIMDRVGGATCIMNGTPRVHHIRWLLRHQPSCAIRSVDLAGLK